MLELYESNSGGYQPYLGDSAVIDTDQVSRRGIDLETLVESQSRLKSLGRTESKLYLNQNLEINE